MYLAPNSNLTQMTRVNLGIGVDTSSTCVRPEKRSITQARPSTPDRHAKGQTSFGLALLELTQHSMDISDHHVIYRNDSAKDCRPVSCDTGYAGANVNLSGLIRDGLFNGRANSAALSYASASRPALVSCKEVPFVGMDVSDGFSNLHNICCNMTDQQFNEYKVGQQEEELEDEDLVFAQSDFDREQMDLEDDLLSDGDSVDPFGDEPEDFEYREYECHARALNRTEMCRRHIAMDDVQMIVSGLEFAITCAEECLSLWPTGDAKWQHANAAVFHLKEASRIAVLRCVKHQFDDDSQLTEVVYQEQLPQRRILESHVNKALEELRACVETDN